MPYCLRYTWEASSTNSWKYIDVYDKPYNPECLSFFKVKKIVKSYGYNTKDLIYYKELGKNLNDVLKLVSLDH